MNIKLKAVGYTVLFCLGILGGSLGIATLIPYIQPWMGLVFVFAFIFYLLYTSILSGLEFDQSVDKMRGDLTKLTDKK